MAMSSPIRAIPGSFGSEFGQSDHNILPPKLDVNVGPRSHIFQPPRTPSASSSLVQSYALSDYQTPGLSGGASRKRPRHAESQHGDRISGRPGRPGWSINKTSLASSTSASPAPLANTRYRLAGGMERPSGVTNLSNRDGLDSSAVVTDEKVRTGTKRGYDEDDYDDYGFHSFTPTSRNYQRSGAFESQNFPSPDQSREGWTRLMLDVFGTVAGRVWEFCRASAFRGFSAGGGRAYQMDGVNDDSHHGSGPAEREKDDTYTRQSGFVQSSTALASSLPEEDLTGSYVNLDNSPTRASKRVQREKGESESRDRWIMVSSTTSPSTVDRRTRASEAGVSEKANVRKGRAALERVAASRPGRRPAVASTTPTRPSRPPASFASPRASPSLSTDVAMVSPETRRLMAQHRRRERATDASIQQFNARLKAMIQQGQEALGTSYTIEDHGPDADSYESDGDDAGDDMMDF